MPSPRVRLQALGLVIASGALAACGISRPSTASNDTAEPYTGEPLSVSASGFLGEEFADLPGRRPRIDMEGIKEGAECLADQINTPATPEQRFELDSKLNVHPLQRRLGVPKGSPESEMPDRVVTHICSQDRSVSILGTAQGDVILLGDPTKVAAAKAAMGPTVHKQQKGPDTQLQGAIVAMVPSRPNADPLLGSRMLASDGGEHNLGNAPADTGADGRVKNAVGVIEYRGVRAYFTIGNPEQNHESLPLRPEPDAELHVAFIETKAAEPGALQTLVKAVDAVQANLNRPNEVFAGLR